MKNIDERNKETSGREVSEFLQNPPERYFLYVWPDKKMVGTWMGDKLGEITSLGPVFKSGFWPGADRRSIRFTGINGVIYSGWYFCGSGDYARVKRVKSKGTKL